jgi:DNA polymerase-4
MGRVILHLDMDAFYASVEQRDHPDWRGKPVVVGSAPDRRGVVCTASYEARTFGVRSAMPSRTAGRLCPQGIFVAPDLAKYRAESQRIFALLREVSPVIEPLSLDEAFLDASGRVADLDGGARLASDLKARIRDGVGLTASVGVASNKFLAKLASDHRKPDGLTVIRDEEKVAFLRPLPVQRLWGVGPKTAARLQAAGMDTIGDVQDYRGNLGAVVGNWATELQQLARGEDERPVHEPDEAKSIGSEETFDADTRSAARVRSTLLSQCEEVARELRREGLGARTVTLKLRWADFTTITRSHSFQDPTQDDGLLFETVWRLAERERGTGRAVRLVGVTVSKLGRPDAQLRLFDDVESRRTRLARQVDGLEGRVRRAGPG